MNIEEKIDICAMKLNGYTLQEIGDKYGVSGERIRQILQGICNPKPRRCHADWLYPNIANGLMNQELAIIDWGNYWESPILLSGTI